MEKRLEWLDFLKGIGIFLVVLGHVYLKCMVLRTDVFNFIIVFHMPFFFMLSGILAWKAVKRNLLGSIRKKVVTLILPFLCVGGGYALTFDDLHDFVWGDFHSGYWFLLSLLICWLMFLPLAKVVSMIPNFYGKIIFDFIILFIPFFLGGGIVNSILSMEYVHALTFSMTFAYYRFFVVGYFLGIIYNNYHGQMMRWWNEIESISILVFFVLMLLCMQGVSPDNYISETGLQFSLCLSFAGVCIAYRNSLPKIVRRWVVCCGRESLSIYCFHYFVIKTIDMKMCSSLSPFLLFIVASFASVFVMLITIVITKPIGKNEYLSKILLGK